MGKCAVIFAYLTVLVVVCEGTGNHAPSFKFDFYKPTVLETFTPGGRLEQPTAIDPDGDPLLYSITSGNTNNQFTIDSTTGVIINTKPLDRETVPSYTLYLAAVDVTSHQTATAKMVVVVSDVNDNGPHCSTPQHASVCEVAPPGQVVISLGCRDDDTGPNAESTYAIQHPGYLPFNVSQYGNILVASPLAFRDDKKTAGFNTFSFPVGVRNVAYPHHETVVRVRIDIHQSACLTGWQFERSPERYLSVNVVNAVTASSVTFCTQQCRDGTRFRCNSVNWDVVRGRCEMVTETAYTRPGRWMDRPGTVLLRKYCVAEPEPSPYLKLFLSKLPGVSGLVPYKETYPLLEMLRLYTECPDDQTHVDVWWVTDGLLTLVDRTNFTEMADNATEAVVQSMVDTVSNLLQDMFVGHWATLHEKGHESSKILRTMETLTTALAATLTTNFTVTAESLVVRALHEDADQLRDQLLDITPGDGTPSTVYIPADVLATGSDSVNLVVSVYDNVDRITNVTAAVRQRNSTEPHGRDSRVVGDVISVVVRPPVAGNISRPVVLEIESTLPDSTVRVISRACVFLDDLGGRDVWRPDGCTTTSHNVTHTRCECHHLTNFAVLMQIYHVESVCRVIACLLHYFYLTVFSLMLAEGLQLYLKLYLAFKKDIKVTVCLVLGWSLPLLLVGVAVGVDPDGYGTSYSCWLSTSRGTIWGFVGPALATGLINLFVLVLVIKTFLSLKVNARKTDRQKFLSSLKAASVLLPLLGITWTFGALAINSNTVAFQYVFALLNSSQGLFIFLFHVVFNDEVRTAYWKRRGRILTVHSVSHSHSTAISSTCQNRRKAFGLMTSTHM
ncbi:adhesion G protein-coupled receptor L4-like [Haliotis cracherodii]|uniref:adhesion G protein-coupled receptor L4-like n=1 Tax=Haliotis cracherodii TaxID=6455 RepID=UPI0039EA896F